MQDLHPDGVAVNRRHFLRSATALFAAIACTGPKLLEQREHVFAWPKSAYPVDPFRQEYPYGEWTLVEGEQALMPGHGSRVVQTITVWR